MVERNGTGPPQALRAERVVLRLCLVHPSTAVEATDRLSQYDFADDGHRTLFGALSMLRARGEPIDLVSVATLLDSEPQLSKWTPSDVEALVDDAEAATGPENASYYIRHVAEKAAQRRALSELHRLDVSNASAPEVLRSVAESLAYANRGVQVPASLRLEDLTDDLDDPDFALVGFMEKGQLVLVVAPKKHGKTTLGIDVSISCALGRRVGGRQGIPTGGPFVVVHLDQENSNRTLRRRLRLMGAADAIRTGRLHVLHRAGVRLSEESGTQPIRAKVEELRRDPALAELPFLLVVDSWAGIADERDQNNNAERETRVRRLLEVIHDLDLSCIVLGNTGHQGDHIKGGIVLDDLADGRLNLKVREDGSRYVTVSYQRGDFEPAEDYDIHRNQDLDDRIRLTLSPRHFQPVELDQTDRDILRALLGGATGPKDIADQYAQRDRPLNARTIQRRREKLLKAGVLKVERKRWCATGEATGHLEGAA